MQKRRLLPLSAAASFLFSFQAVATPFPSYDPVSMSMGGMGVGLPMQSTATLFNPAQLAMQAEGKRFNAGVHLGARAYDPEDAIDGIDDIADLFDDIDRLAGEISGGLAQDEAAVRAELAGKLASVDAKLRSIDRSPLQVEVGLGLMANRPSKANGLGLSISGTAAVGARMRYNDQELLADLRDAAENNNPINYDEDDLTSEVEAVGVGIAEIGISYAREIRVRGQTLAVGITPKYMNIETIYYKASASDGDTDDFDASENRKSYADFNVDLGAMTQFDNGTYLGLVVRNLIPRTYKTATVNGSRESISLNPQARMGVGYDGGWYRGGVDVDLTRNKPVAFEDASQYVALGGEISAWGWAQFRAGYRMDVANTDRNVASAGLGVSPFRVFHLDLGVSGNRNELGAAASMALAF